MAANTSARAGVWASWEPAVVAEIDRRAHMVQLPARSVGSLERGASSQRSLPRPRLWLGGEGLGPPDRRTR